MVRKSENLEKSQKIIFFLTWNFWKYFFFAEQKKNAILLVLPIEEISLRPKLSSPPRFRIQWGSHERYERKKSSCLILEDKKKYQQISLFSQIVDIKSPNCGYTPNWGFWISEQSFDWVKYHQSGIWDIRKGKICHLTNKIPMKSFLVSTAWGFRDTGPQKKV